MYNKFEYLCNNRWNVSEQCGNSPYNDGKIVSFEELIVHFLSEREKIVNKLNNLDIEMKRIRAIHYRDINKISSLVDEAENIIK